MRTKLSNGTTGFYREDGTWQCTGSRMGRRNAIPDADKAPKLTVERLRWTDGDYDQGGAYWGGGHGDYIYRAEGDAPNCDESFEIFVRARHRAEAKAKVQALVPFARFYR